jgi:hypothetical protein
VKQELSAATAGRASLSFLILAVNGAGIRSADTLAAGAIICRPL